MSMRMQQQIDEQRAEINEIKGHITNLRQTVDNLTEMVGHLIKQGELLTEKVTTKEERAAAQARVSGAKAHGRAQKEAK